MAETWGKEYDAFAKALWRLCKSTVMVWQRRHTEKPEGPETPGKMTLKGPEWRQNSLFHPLFSVSKQTANRSFWLYFVSV
jgi:hypothetical protein